MELLPTFAEFKRLFRRGKMLPLRVEIPLGDETPESIYLKMRDGEPSALLESVEGETKLARYSFIASQPRLLFGFRKGRAWTRKPGGPFRQKVSADPVSELESLLGRRSFAKGDGLPRFWGGAIGYLSYDVVRAFENLPERLAERLNLPESQFLFTDVLFAVDHLRKAVSVICPARGYNARAAYRNAERKIGAALGRLNRPLRQSSFGGRTSVGGKTSFKSEISRTRFLKMVHRAKRYIKEGDIIQVVLSQRFSAQFSGDTFEIYRQLRRINPSPYMYYLNFGELKIIGTSPEILVRKEDCFAEVRPIAGTRPRGKTPDADEALARELLADPKERAEHVMLVDLGRNDLGRVCERDSIRVTLFMNVERYSHVMHIVTDIIGKLSDGKTAFDLLRASFPAGTVAGAPKIRAMEIVEELEASRRGPYAGAVGYFGYDGNMDFAINIRSVVVQGKRLHIQAGAGIVADSIPEREYQETLNKAKAMFSAIEAAR